MWQLRSWISTNDRASASNTRHSSVVWATGVASGLASL
jgi:hypothetical protein